MKIKGVPQNAYWLDRGWFDKPVSKEQAEAFCRNLARMHYENFTVVSFLLPRRLRQHLSNIYAYCRVADDLADELGDPDISVDRLQEWRENLRLCYQGKAAHPVFIALGDTISRFEIPRDPFERLLTAFLEDQTKTRYETWDELLAYCSNSANPVGHLVLYVCGYRDSRRRMLSDQTCTALQLTNFWQDVARDYERGRIYIPRQLLQKYGISESSIAARNAGPGWAELMRELLQRTRPLFSRGMNLGPLVASRLRLDIELFSRGGLEILRQIERIGYNTLQQRPRLTKWGETRLVLGALFRTLWIRHRAAG